MKKINLSIIILLSLISLSTISAQVVPIPSSVFKAYLLGNSAINTNGDSEIQNIEAFSFNGKIDVRGLGIADLSGIEYFLSLRELDCSVNSIGALDISNSLNLTHLNCSGNALDSLNIRANVNLTHLDFSSNGIDSIDLSQNTALLELDCSWNFMAFMDISANLALTHLACRLNGLDTLNVSQHTNLISLKCDNNSLTSIDVSSNTQLLEIDCGGNSLASLDISNNVVLEKLYCSFNVLDTLNISANLVIEYLWCGNNLLTMLDLSNNPSLASLHCSNNQLTDLDLSGNLDLETLSCPDNQIGTLDLSQNTKVRRLECQNNQLSMLNFQNGNNNSSSGGPVYSFNANNNPSLSCIQVDDAAFSTANWTNIDSGAVFSVNCYTNTGKVRERGMMIDVSPNPTTNKVRVSLSDVGEEVTILVYSLVGELLLTQEFNDGQYFDLDLRDLQGVLLVKVITERGEKVLKVLKN